MDTTIRIDINNSPKILKLYFAMFPLLGILLIPASLDNDFYFLYPTGQYILENGFPVKDFLSMHSDMNIIVQQWLTDILFYIIYSNLGKIGLIAFTYLCYIVFCVLMFKLTFLISKNFIVTAICSFFADILLAASYYLTRPQIITYILIISELILLESFVQKGKVKFLFGLPVLSLLLVNLHSSMWLLFFIFAVPFVCESIPIHYKRFNQEPCCSLAKLLICGVVCFAVGFVNPYGTKAMFYVVSSFGIPELNEYIGEMKPLSIDTNLGKIFFFVIFTLAAIMIALRKNNFKTRYVLLFIGTLILSVINLKSIAYFYICAIPAFSYYVKALSFKYTDNNRKKKKSKKSNHFTTVTAGIIIFLLVFLTCGFSYYYHTEEEKSDEDFLRYSELSKAADILDNEKGEVVLYTAFDNGPYMEFRGYHPYIDCRAELFVKKNNGEFDYMRENNDVVLGQTYYKDFVDKYGFNYLLVGTTEISFENQLIHDGGFVKVYDSDLIRLYKRK